MQNLAINDDDDSEEERRKKAAATLAERQEKAKQEREEKQRKYAEVRERLFGGAVSGESSGNASHVSRTTSGAESRGSSRKSRGQSSRGSGPNSSAEQSPARNKGQNKQLFDPGFLPKPGSSSMKNSTQPTVPKADQPIRMPRGPDSSGRGGFGFASRGGGPS